MHHPNQDHCPNFSPNVLWDCFCARARARQHHNPHSFFLWGIHQDGICCCCPSRLLCFIGDSVPDAAGRLACAVRAASVARVTRVPHVTAAALVFAASFCLFFVDPDARVIGDQGHVFAPSARGFLSREGFLFVSTRRSCGDDATATIIVVAR
jgi:hypothetical protein